MHYVCIVLYSLLRFVRREVLYYNKLCCIVEQNELDSDVLHVGWVVGCVGGVVLSCIML